MSKLFYSDKPIIGLDIGQTGARIMSIDNHKGVVHCYGSVDLDPSQLNNSIEASNQKFLTESLLQLQREKLVGSLPSKRAVVSIPTGHTYTRTITLPTSAEKSLQSAIILEAEQYIPTPVSELNIDYEIIERKKDTLTLLMCAAPKKIIDNLVQATTDAGFEVVMIEPSITAVARLLKATERANLPSIILDIGATSTDIAAIDGGSIRVTGSTAIGGNTFTLDIAKQLNTSLESAHQLKVLNGLNVSPRQEKLRAALAPSLDAIIKEVKKIIRYYNERLEGTKLEQLLIVGSGANIPGLGDYFTNSLIIAARIANPWQAINFDKLTPPAREIKPRYLTAAGLASVRPKEIWR